MHATVKEMNRIQPVFHPFLFPYIAISFHLRLPFSILVFPLLFPDVFPSPSFLSAPDFSSFSSFSSFSLCSSFSSHPSHLPPFLHTFSFFFGSFPSISALFAAVSSPSSIPHFLFVSFIVSHIFSLCENVRRFLFAFSVYALDCASASVSVSFSSPLLPAFPLLFFNFVLFSAFDFIFEMFFFAFLVAFFSFTICHLFSRSFPTNKVWSLFSSFASFLCVVLFLKNPFSFLSLCPNFHFSTSSVFSSRVKFCCKCVEFCHCFVQTRFVFAPIMVICALLGSCGDSVLSVPFVCVWFRSLFGFVQNQDSDSELIQNGGPQKAGHSKTC